MSQWCAKPTGVPSRPECAGEQCPHCREVYGPRGFVPGMFHCELFSGGYIDLAAPGPDAIAFEDVAHSLSTQTRYTGHCRVPYSVAEHTVLVAWRLEELGCDWPVVLAGLNHDDAEVLTGDIGRPLKRLLGDAFTPIEERCHAAVTAALGISRLPFDDRAVKEADEWALMQEAYRLMPSRGENWYPADRYPKETLLWQLGLPWHEAKRRWMVTYDRLLRLV
jgi:hypothetical protein